ncbi:hypothetical protein PMAC_000995 [Pneumocystis sp. 'macacae']|nr:hypothetical protein PMAC_000995 [Pneumocystis sp. 'macacae']
MSSPETKGDLQENIFHPEIGYTKCTKTSISERHYDEKKRKLNTEQENLEIKEIKTDRRPKRKSSLNRAARTDRGVHAACNLISLKMIIEQQNLLEAINTALPETIRMWSITRTLRSFNPKTFCDSRIYEYLVPSYVFVPPYPMSFLAQRVSKRREIIDKEKNSAWIYGNEYMLYCKDSKNIWSSEKQYHSKALNNEVYILNQITNENHKKELSESNQIQELQEKEEARRMELKIKKEYRISAERLQLVRDAFKIFEGSHNFHNFTIGKPFNDKSVYRVIRSFTVSDPKIIKEIEWISLKVHGQSFMLHQIRKMVALIILVVRCGTPLSFISETFKSTRYNIPKAPGFGLLLEKPIFTGYNKRAENMNREVIDSSLYEKEIEKFKETYIYDKIFSEESKENIYHGFLIHIDSCTTNDFDYLTLPTNQLIEYQQKNEHISSNGKNTARGIHENNKKLRVSFKISLNNPYNIQWPQIDEKDKEMILEKVLNLFSSFSNYKKDEISQEKSSKSIEKSSSDMKNNSGSSEVANENVLSLHKIDKKLIAKHMTLGINETTKQLEMYSSLEIPSSAPNYLKNEKKKDEKYISILKNNKSVKILKVIFVCCEDISSSILYSHFPILCGVVNEIFSKIETHNNDFQPGIRLVALPKGSEQQLSKAVGLKRLAAMGIMKNTPYSEEIIKYIFKKIPPVHIPWITHPTSFQTTSISQTLYGQ